MTVRADRLTKRAKIAGVASSVPSSYPASSARVFVDALEWLNYSVESLLGDAGIRRADLDDPDARIPSAAWDAMFRRALELRPMKNVGMRLATVTPFGAFPLVDYLIATSEPAAFTRAFRRWNDEAPQAFRQRQRSDQHRLTGSHGRRWPGFPT